MRRLVVGAAVIMVHSAGTLGVPFRQFDNAQSVLESYCAAACSGSSTTTASGAPMPPPKPVGLPVSNPTKSFWTGNPGANPLASEGSQGDLTQDADICIIGSGITGISVTYHLSGSLGGYGDARTGTCAENANSTRKRTVVVLEARDFCSGATGRNGGHLLPLIFLDFSRREALYGTEEAVKSYKLENYTSSSLIQIIRDTDGDTTLGDVGGSVDFVDGGHVTLFVTEEEERAARRDFDAAKAAGLSGLDQVKWIDHEAMHRDKGVSYPGVQIPGHNLWPLKLVTRLFKLAQRRSPLVEVKLHTHTPVTDILSPPKKNHDDDQEYEVVTPRGNVRCKYVLHATNGYANYLLSPEKTGIQIVPTRGQIVGTRAAVGAERIGKVSWDANEGFEYWFSRPVKGEDEGGRPLVILGGGREVTGPKFELYETDDGELNLKTGKALKQFLPRVFPHLFPSTPQVEWEWTGIMGFTKLGDPFVGPVFEDGKRLHGQYVAAGYTGHGMPRGYACGEAIAGMVAGDVNGELWKQPEWLPNHYLTDARKSSG